MTLEKDKRIQLSFPLSNLLQEFINLRKETIQTQKDKELKKTEKERRMRRARKRMNLLKG
jgi:hypothetical protein